MAKKCTYNKCNYPVWSKGFCRIHAPKKAIKPKKQSPMKESEKRQESEKMWELFRSLWNERGHYSEIGDNTYLGKEPLSTYFHHILEKRNYPQAKFDPENIIILSPEEHQKAENDIYFYEEINRRRIYLKEKYNL